MPRAASKPATAPGTKTISATLLHSSIHNASFPPTLLFCSDGRRVPSLPPKQFSHSLPSKPRQPIITQLSHPLSYSLSHPRDSIAVEAEDDGGPCMTHISSTHTKFGSVGYSIAYSLNAHHHVPPKSSSTSTSHLQHLIFPFDSSQPQARIDGACVSVLGIVLNAPRFSVFAFSFMGYLVSIFHCRIV